ncbi:hypothetical protein V1478_006003 [Vespula squamosa]|uniref:Uncharacterized protein n=1 Tax=Vespula squamosa TaxID=30214 RepID=A0ABD2B906_VESSQ
MIEKRGRRKEELEEEEEEGKKKKKQGKETEEKKEKKVVSQIRRNVDHATVQFEGVLCVIAQGLYIRHNNTTWRFDV